MSLDITEKVTEATGGISRRNLLKSIGLAAAGATVGGSYYFQSTGGAEAAPSFEVDEVSISLREPVMHS